jgi:hypothetical protein
MKGYLNKPAETEDTLKNGWMHTGDMGHLDEDGDLFITGRKKDLIIRGGENISPGAVEDVLFAHERSWSGGWSRSRSCLRGGGQGFRRSEPGYQVTEAETDRACLKSLPRFKAPKTIGFLKELPKSPVGKILKRELVRWVDGSNKNPRSLSCRHNTTRMVPGFFLSLCPTRDRVFIPSLSSLLTMLLQAGPATGDTVIQTARARLFGFLSHGQRQYVSCRPSLPAAKRH